jgi:hypothetical protein
MKTTLFALFTASALALTAGCASQTELDEVRLLAENAQRTASSASECCAMTTQKVDRMYQKVMSK